MRNISVIFRIENFIHWAKLYSILNENTKFYCKGYDRLARNTEEFSSLLVCVCKNDI